MLTLEHIALSLPVILLAAWWWRGMGLRELALRQVRQHCRKADVQLLDESIVLRRLRLSRNRRGRWGIGRRYGFEFTVTGERRYNGCIDLHGARFQRIALDPHPFPGAPDSEHDTIHATDNGRTLH
ncbi:DUF3301 domain-containing protein [Halopseudomonas salegens]|uniref:DUF3301 domain-containing protein n=1 Tax=Halopseudomonas salegens TaxID=1434072 RepID=A0A1H2HPH6_9GAMM|nr:DUF3301 domain-containing protein [Halopseudomonas salegens]SDU33712.1 Protein of unknown function [Halopseudomonas salegens]